MKQKIINIVGIFFLVIGITLLLYPEIISYLKQKQSDQTVKELTQRRSKRKQDDLLYQKAVRYNRKIFKEKQAGLKDVFSYRSAPIVLRNEKNTFGYIKIPKMKQKLPLYLGATMENMRKGAAIMGQTSLPVGQKDSNCVIAAHRGYRGIPYFRDIEQLKTGDQVIIRNPWERLDYRVTKIKVIDPYDMDKILIQKREDMVTLITCHPYRGHGRYRYVVYCMRNHGTEDTGNKRKIDKNRRRGGYDEECKKRYLERKRKIIVVLVVMVSFVSVLAWYQMKKAHAYQSYNTGGNKHFKDGHLTVNINGPNGKSDSLTMYIHSDEYEKNKNVSGGTFNNSRHPYTVTTYSGGGGDYKLTVNKQTIYSEKNSNNNYTLLTIKVWYLLPAHEQHRSWEWVTVDKPVFSDPSKDITLYCGGNDGFWENSYHDTQEHWKSVNIHVSTGLVGVASADRDGWKTYDWCSINLNLEKPSRSIYYNGNGGDGADVTWNFTDGDYFSFPTVSRRGYTLEGWLDEGTKWMSNTGWLVCGNYTETAQWTANTYTVNYDGNRRRSGYVNDGTATYDQNYSFAENGYTKKRLCLCWMEYR